jgi:homoserine kinase
LGSSSGAAVAGIVAANELLGQPLVKNELLALAASIEGHPDNSAAALYGGCQIVVHDGDRLVTSSVSVPDELRAVVFVPEVPMPTIEARSVLPTEISVQDAVFNMGRVGLLVNALATGDLTHLAIGTQDRLHQPPRQQMFHPMKVILRAALEAGAVGAFLSGAGSSILALTRGREMTVGYEMADAASKSGVDGDVIVTKPTSSGAQVI